MRNQKFERFLNSSSAQLERWMVMIKQRIADDSGAHKSFLSFCTSCVATFLVVYGTFTVPGINYSDTVTRKNTRNTLLSSYYFAPCKHNPYKRKYIVALRRKTSIPSTKFKCKRQIKWSVCIFSLRNVVVPSASDFEVVLMYDVRTLNADESLWISHVWIVDLWTYWKFRINCFFVGVHESSI